MRTHAVWWLFLTAIACICFVGYWGVQGTLRVVDGWAADVPSTIDTEFTNTAKKSVMYAGDGSTVLAEFQLEKREPVESDAVSDLVKKATVDTEDVRFYEHSGVDIQGIARALVNNLAGGDLEGASTITQQLVRNTVLTQEANDISFERKVREAELALDLEKQYSKDEILLMYLNTINYGDGCYGIEAAAQNYFQKHAADLTLAQAATLAGIPQSPTYLNPKTYPDAALARRNLVLDRMLSAGDIDQAEHDAAQAEALGLSPAPDAPEEGIYAYPYFTSYVRQLLLAENNPYGCSYADLFEGGLTIYTSLDPSLQQAAETACANQNARMANDLASSIVAVDAKTGQVKALVGGKDYASAKVNIATGTGGTGRQAGSTFKAFTLAAAIEQGVNPLTRIDCTSPLTKSIDGVEQSFENFGGADYGIRTIADATNISSNTGYLRLSERIGQQSTTDMAKRLGVQSPVGTVYTTTLGTADVTPLDMANAYATLANGGDRHDPVVVTKIVNQNGAVLYEADGASESAVSSEVAAATTNVLRGVFESADGTAHDAQLANGQPVAGKTGTSTKFADHWLVGYTPSLSCAAWIGNPSGSISTDENMNANALWKDFMDRATAGKAVEQFPSTDAPTYNNSFNDEQNAKLGVEPGAEGKTTAEGITPLGSGTKTTKTDTAPNVVGKTLEEAASLLKDFKAGYQNDFSSTVPKGSVIRQYAQSDGTVVLVVSKGPAS